MCYHEFEQGISSVTNGKWCIYCSNLKLCSKEDCKICFEKSFASHEKAIYWCDKNDLQPRYIVKNTHKKYWFNCDKCPHIFDIILTNIIKGQWCSYCNGNHKLCNDNDCKICYDKSFESHEKSKYWSIHNELKPRQVHLNSNKSFKFICEKNHNIIMSLGNINYGYWCKFCINKTEQKLYDILILYYIELKQQYKVDWCKNKTYLPFDFVLEDDKIIIELDGLQHFEQVSNWDSPEKTNINDKYKMKCANLNGFSIIRLLQKDVFYDTYNWLEDLKTNIEKLKNDNIIQNIYMCKNNEYYIFDNLEQSNNLSLGNSLE